MARQTAAEKAFKAAQMAIAEAAKSGRNVLDFSGKPFTALDRIPDEIAGLTGLTLLNFDNTKVSDLEPLKGLKALKWLYISGTKVSDLEPLRGLKALKTISLRDAGVSDLEPLKGLTGLTRLSLSGSKVSDLEPLRGLTELKGLGIQGTGVSWAGLHAALRGKTGLIPPEDKKNRIGIPGVHLTDCLAAREDARIAEIAKIEDDRDRTIALFEELGLEWRAAPPEADPLLPVVIEGGKLEIPASFPSPDEQDERLKRALHERMKPKAAAAAQKAGNEFPRMAAKTRVLGTLLDKPFEELDLLSIHLEVEDINERAKAGGEDGIPYDADLLATVAEVSRLGPGLTRDNVEVELYFERLQKTRETPADAESEALRAQLSEKILATPNAHGDRSLSLEGQIINAEDPDVARTLRPAKHKNMLWKLATVAALVISPVASDLAASLIASAYGAEITAFVTTNWALLMEVAATYGAAFASWIGGSVGMLMIGKGLREEVRKRKDRDGGDSAP